MHNPTHRSVRVTFAVVSILAFHQLTQAQPTPAEKADDSESALVDPLIWDPPHDMPAVQAQMDIDAYHKALADAVKKVDMAKVQQPDESLHGLQQPIDVDTPWNPQTAYWSSPQRDSSWNDQMLVACTALDSDPKLASTALWDARNLGYKGWLFAPLEARIAWTQWRFDDALAFGSFALADAPDDRKPVIARWMYGAAKASYKYEEALQLATDYPLADGDELQQLRVCIKHYKALGSQPRPGPLAALKDLSETDLSSKLTAIHVQGSVKSPEQTDGLAKTRHMKLDAPGGHFQLFAFGPKAADVDLTAHFSFHASAGKKTEFDRSLKFGIVDPADKGDEQCEVALFSGGRVEIQGSGPTVGIVEHPTPSWRKEGTIRIIVLGPDVEVFVDDKRAYYGTIRKDATKRALGFLVQAVGIDADVRDVSWKKILATKDDAEKK